MRSITDIEDQCRRLREVRQYVPSESAFGDDNLAAIDAQLDVLNKMLSPDEVDEEYENGDEYVFNNAAQASQWLEGDDESNPADGWEPLAHK